MELKEFYELIEGNYESVMELFLDEELAKTFVKKFVTDPSYKTLHEAVAAEDIEASFRAAHTLKGVAANLGLSRMQKVASNLTEQLRPRESQADAELLAAVDREYELHVQKINEL